MDRFHEVEVKLARVRALLEERGLAGALFAGPGNFAWITGGGQNHVSIASERGVGAILVTDDRAYLLADNIEWKRLEAEELDGLSFEVRRFPWWISSLTDEVLRRAPSESLLTDVPIPGARMLDAQAGIAMRNPLLEPEIERYRVLGEDVAVVLTHVAFHCRPGLSEHQLAGMLGKGLMDFGITPAVTLVAVDERVYTRRHPIATDRRLERHAMLVVGGRRAGLNLSATRLVYFGPVPEELREKHAACARVDGAFIGATRPGAMIADVFAAGQAAYAAEGYSDEWQQHHQGGPTGYAGRDIRATPDSPGEVQHHQAFAWNPSIAGTKSEDTLITTDAGVEVLSRTPDLPELLVDAGDQELPRAAILER